MNKPALPKFPPLREPVLPQECIDLGFSYAKDPKLAADFLKRVGIMDENGQLAEPYRPRNQHLHMKEPVMPKFPPLREPVLPQEAIDLGFSYAKDPKLAAAFLKRVGIMDENGELAEPYRLQE